MNIQVYTREGRILTVKFPLRTPAGKKLAEALEEFRIEESFFAESEIIQISAEWGKESK